MPAGGVERPQAGTRSPVIARSEATRQSPTRRVRRLSRAGDCFVASLLAMTATFPQIHRFTRLLCIFANINAEACINER
jgi:hypothetical protein